MFTQIHKRTGRLPSPYQVIREFMHKGLQSTSSRAVNRPELPKLLVRFTACVVLLSLPVAVLAAVPELPRTYIDSSYRPSTGVSLHVPAGASVQAAIEKAQPGDTILLEPGVTYVGPIVLTPKGRDGWITIRTSGTLPEDDIRITKTQFAALPKIVTPDSRSAVTMPAGSQQYRFLGVEITTKATLTWNIVYAMPNSHDLIFDRCYIHGTPTAQSFRGVMMDGDAIAIVNSHVDDIHFVGFDSQAVGGSAGRGPYKIVNNYLAAAGENIMFGGSRAPAGVTPSDIEIRRNYLHKPAHWEQNTSTWDGSKWTIKNLFELKHAQRVLVEDNVLDGTWPQAQTGSAVLFTVATGQSGCHAVVSDITFRRNLIRNTVSGFSLLGWDYGQPDSCRGESRRVLVEENLIIHRPATAAFHVSWNWNTHDYVFRRNTFVNSAPCRFSVFFGGSRPVGINNVMIGNVLCRQVLGDAMDYGYATLSKFIGEPAPLEDRFKWNVIYVPPTDPLKPHPPDNYLVAKLPFANAALKDFRLVGDAKYAGIGADTQQLQTMATAVEKGINTAILPPPVVVEPPPPAVVEPPPPVVVEPPPPAVVESRFTTDELARLLGRAPSQLEIRQFVEPYQTGSRASAIAAVFMSPAFTASSRFIAGLYVGLLDRDPEFSGWSYQRQALLSGITSQEELVNNFLGSPEFKLKYGLQTNEAFIRMLYRQVLFREASAAELSFHVSTLANRIVSRTQVAKNFLNSVEFGLGAEHRVTVFLAHACLEGTDVLPAVMRREVEDLGRGKPLSQFIAEVLAN